MYSSLAKTGGQEKYIKALKDTRKPIVVAIGPAGTGKTFLACQEGINSIAYRHVDNLVITRPTKSVDEDHGYLPGDINKKLAPWLQPIFDSIKKSDYSGKSKIKNSIEISPLAYMRGRTFDHSWIIADEMQNATANQMKMMLTRIGDGSKLVVTGDLQQIDVRDSGLLDFLNRLEKYPNPEHIEFVELSSDDIIRHEAVKEVLNVYSDK